LVKPQFYSSKRKEKDHTRDKRAAGIPSSKERFSEENSESNQRRPSPNKVESSKISLDNGFFERDPNIDIIEKQEKTISKG